MNDMVMKAVEATKPNRKEDESIEKILTKYLDIEQNIKDENAGYVAWATSALSAGITLANLFIAVNRPGSNRGYAAITDLAYVLNHNEFWARNSNFLMPIVIVALNAHKDYVSLLAETDDKKEYGMYDRVMRGSELTQLEVFVAILFLVGGPDLMAKYSTPLKLDLAPYFLG